MGGTQDFNDALASVNLVQHSPQWNGIRAIENPLDGTCFPRSFLRSFSLLNPIVSRPHHLSQGFHVKIQRSIFVMLFAVISNVDRANFSTWDEWGNFFSGFLMQKRRSLRSVGQSFARYDGDLKDRKKGDITIQSSLRYHVFFANQRVEIQGAYTLLHYVLCDIPAL